MCKKTTPWQNSFIVGYVAAIFSGFCMGWNVIELAERHDPLLVLEIVSGALTIVGAVILHIGVIKETKLPIIVWIVVAFICGVFLLVVRIIHLANKWDDASTLYITIKILITVLLVGLTILYILCPYLYIVQLNEEEK